MMVRSLATLFLFLAALAPLVLGQAANGAASGASASGQCGAQGQGASCPEDAPCCSTYGQCGVGAYCLGGCNPKYSFNLQSCMPAPSCKSQDYKMNSLDDISPNTKYLGDASEANWVSSGTPVAYQNEAVLLTMAPSTVGTLLSSTHYVWYGKISATLQTSQGQGVVTAFILMSDVQDEVDFEFIGTDVNNAQSNYYYQGITNYDNMDKLQVSSDTRANSHVYEIDWQPDQLTWSVDGQVMRTVKRSDTYNNTAKQYYYPQTPARIMLSLWPAGLSTNGEGTIEWAGGLVDWDSKYMQEGYYSAIFSDVSVKCYDPPSGTSGSGDSYMYTNIAGTQGDVEMTNDNTVLGSFLADGNNQDKGKEAATGTKSAGSAATSEVQSVPGMTGGGAPGEDNSSVGSNGDGSGSTAGSNGGYNGGSQVGGSGISTFSQGVTESTGDADRTVAGSMVALVAVFAAALML